MDQNDSPELSGDLSSNMFHEDGPTNATTSLIVSDNSWVGKWYLDNSWVRKIDIISFMNDINDSNGI